MKSIYSHLHDRVEKEIRHRQLLAKDRKLAIAVSGGQDSVCLARLCLDLAIRWRWKIIILHCDHGWETDGGIKEFVGKLARDWDVGFDSRKAIDLAETEGAARQWRYRVLTEMVVANSADYLLVGHTQTDRAETLLYNLARGSGMAGLAAINWRRELVTSLGKVDLIRPLLTVSRQETLEFCQAQNLPIWQDKYNDDRRFTRNRIRADVMPSICENINDLAEIHFARSSEILRAENDYLTALATNIYHQLKLDFTELPAATIAEIQHILSPARKLISTLDRRSLAGEHLALQRRVLHLWLREYLATTPGFATIEDTLRCLHSPNRTQTGTLPRQCAVLVWQQYICLHSVK
jgi:tRNA(Ile)-lysidine synthase